MLDRDVHISVVSFNTRELLDRCLASIFASSGSFSLSVTVADNGSTDGSKEMVHDKYPGVRVVETGGNIGYGRANNAALLNTTGRYYLILNSDVFLSSTALGSLIGFLDSHLEYAAAGANLRNPGPSGAEDGGPQTNWAAGELTLASVVYEQTFLAKLFPKSHLFGDLFRAYWNHEGDTMLPQVCGACLIVRANVFNDLGGFDPIYFMYAEDTDLCKRIWTNGGKVGYVAAARAIHLHGQSSTGKFRARMVIEHNRSRYIYFALHYSLAVASAAKAVMAFGALLRGVIWSVLALAGKDGAGAKATAFLRVFAATVLLRLPGRVKQRLYRRSGEAAI